MSSEHATEIQAVSMLGRAVHVAAVGMVLERALRDPLDEEDIIKTEGEVLTYGSAWSGVDTVAEALTQVVWLDQRWRYMFASEKAADSRRVLLAAWGTRGLRKERMHKDAAGAAAVGEAYVDLYVATPECRHHSARNHKSTRKKKAAELVKVRRSFRYICRARPRAVVVENVDEVEVVAAISSLLGRIPGYRWERMVVCPFVNYGEPVRRRRSFWVGRRLG